LRPNCASRSSKVDMSVIEKIKALRRKDFDSEDAKKADMDEKRDETIRKIQERHQRKDLPEVAL